MGHKGFLHLMITFLGFSWLLLSCAAVPSSRSFQLIKEELSAQAALLSQKSRGFYKFPEVEEGYKKGRIVMESIDDYPGTGANTRHDLKPPGRV